MTNEKTNQPVPEKHQGHQPEQDRQTPTGSPVQGQQRQQEPHQGERTDPRPDGEHEQKHDKDGKPVPVVAAQGDKPKFQAKR